MPSKPCFFTFLRIALLFFGIVESSNTNIWSLPSVSASDHIEFYYCETSLPYNTPQNIIDAAGSQFLQYETSHAALGVWDTDTNMKLTIQFISNDFTGSLLPVLSEGRIFWNNSGSVVVTNPLVNDDWINSRHIASTSGVAYTDLVQYLKDNVNGFTVYQPISVVSPRPDQLFPNSSTFQGDTDFGIGDVIVTASDSYSFLNTLLINLADFGCELQTFLQVYATAFSYISNGTATEVVSWEAGGPANPIVYQWFSDLNACYDSNFQAAASAGTGANAFLTGVVSCYPAQAYLYRSPNSVYNITMGSYSTYETPALYRYIYNIPTTPEGVPGGLTGFDIAVIVIGCLAFAWGVYYFGSILLTKKSRRRVSFEGERIAETAVNSMTLAEAEANAASGGTKHTTTTRDYFFNRSAPRQGQGQEGGFGWVPRMLSGDSERQSTTSDGRL